MVKVNFMRMYPEDNTIEQVAYDIGLYFAENPKALGVELFVDYEDGTSRPIGLVRNPAFKSIYEDAFAIYNRYERDTKVRTVEVRWRP
jgi:hypothetical protein